MPTEELWQDLDWLAVAARRRGFAAMAASGRTLRRVHWAGGGLLVDLSLTGLTAEVLSLLNRAAIAAGVFERRAALMAGCSAASLRPGGLPAPALRRPDGASAMIDGEERSLRIAEARHWPETLAAALRDGALTGATGLPFRDVIHLSSAPDRDGPALVLRAMASGGPAVHLLRSVEELALAALMRRLDPATTLVILAAPDLAEPGMTAAVRALQGWLSAVPGRPAASRHMIAVTADVLAAAMLGFAPERIIAAETSWLDGYGIWSPPDLALPIGLGPAAMADLRAGAAEADEHFRTAAPDRNLPVLLGFADLWAGTLLDLGPAEVRAQSPRLAGWPGHAQTRKDRADPRWRELFVDAAPGGEAWSDEALDAGCKALAQDCAAGDAPGIALAHGRLDARMLGRLVALAEHRALVARTLQVAALAPGEPGWRTPGAEPLGAGLPAWRPAARQMAGPTAGLQVV
jgi:glucose-6-phosphate isomerase